MRYILTDLMGADRVRNDLVLAELEQLYAELECADGEHTDVSVRGGPDCEWCLAAHGSGDLVWENVERRDVSPRHMHAVKREHVIELWRRLAAGDIAAIDSEPWKRGYGG